MRVANRAAALLSNIPNEEGGWFVDSGGRWTFDLSGSAKTCSKEGLDGGDSWCWEGEGEGGSVELSL